MLSLDAPNGRAGVLISGGGYRTGVENDDICLGCRANAPQTIVRKLAFNGRSIRLGGAASEVLNVVTSHGVIIAAERGAQFTSQPESAQFASEVLLDGYIFLNTLKPAQYRSPGAFPMKRRILLVDDELAILLTLKAILEINGFEVDTAASGKEAIARLPQNTYQMIITDMRMETETAGYDVIREAKKQDYDPAVAILTAFPLLGSDWKEEGADSMLVKPMNTNDLLRQIEALLVNHEDRRHERQGSATLKKKSANRAPQDKTAIARHS